MPFSIESLEADRKTDLVIITGYFLGLQMGLTKKFTPTAYMLKTVMATIDKLQKAEVGKSLDMEEEEFGVIYAGAQYMMHAMTKPEGAAYVNSIFGDRRTEEFKQEMVEYFRDTCMYFVNECNNKYAEIPAFAVLRAGVERQITEGR